MNMQAAVTMRQLQNKLDVIGHNVANSSTDGYKTRSANFTSLLYQNIDNFSDVEANATGRITPHGIRLGSGARLGHTNINLAAGTINTTNRGLDLALLEDNHLLQVQVTENGVTETRYTRDGALYLQTYGDGQLMLSTRNGHPILGQDGAPIIIDNDIEDVNINQAGQIVVRRNGAEVVEGQLALVEAVRPQFLEQAGTNLFRLPDLTDVAYQADEIIADVLPFENRVQSGALEQSNVNMAIQMTDLIQTQRAYQFNARTISLHDQMRGLVNQLR